MNTQYRPLAFCIAELLLSAALLGSADHLAALVWQLQTVWMHIGAGPSPTHVGMLCGALQWRRDAGPAVSPICADQHLPSGGQALRPGRHNRNWHRDSHRMPFCTSSLHRLVTHLQTIMASFAAVLHHPAYNRLLCLPCHAMLPACFVTWCSDTV